MINIITACTTFFNLTKSSGFAKTPKKRGAVCISADHPQNRSRIDRFPINKISEVKKTLRRINEMTKSPKWWDGSLDELKSIIMKKIGEFYKIEKTDKGIVVIKK